MISKIDMVRSVLASLSCRCGRDVRLMEVCGSHSTAIAKAGIRGLLPGNVRLLSGPGCPVCVSGEKFICRAITLARRKIKLALFGDLLRIPSSLGTLGGEPGTLVIYSPEEAVSYAVLHPGEEVVFAAVGFEPTLAAAAAMMEKAVNLKLKNFSVLSDFKNVLPVLQKLAAESDPRIDGFLLPGHVAAVIGADAFRFLPIPGVISGFSAENILSSLARLLEMIADGKRDVLNLYPSSVRPEGSGGALNLIRRYFESADGVWRGIGPVPGGNWQLREDFSAWDAMKKFELQSIAFPETSSAHCHCGEVLAGKILPAECPLFGKGCTPAHPVGACMVSVEGACAAMYYTREAS